MYMLQRHRFSSEAELHAYCLQVLRSRGIRALSEVETGGLRADIVIPGKVIIELKRDLDRNAIYQAYGQASAYSNSLGIEHVWVVGQCPIDPATNAEAHSIAVRIMAGSPSIKVSFIEEDSFWTRGAVRRYKRHTIAHRVAVAALGIGMLVCTLPYLSQCRIFANFTLPCMHMRCKPLW